VGLGRDPASGDARRANTRSGRHDRVLRGPRRGFASPGAQACHSSGWRGLLPAAAPGTPGPLCQSRPFSAVSKPPRPPP
jgi:hypothetical protein